MSARWFPRSAPMASAETPSAASSAGVTVALLWILKKGTAQVSEGAHPGGIPFGTLGLKHVATRSKAILRLICCHLLLLCRHRWMPHISRPLWPRPVREHPRGLRVQVWWRLRKWIHDDEELHGWVRDRLISPGKKHSKKLWWLIAYVGSSCSPSALVSWPVSHALDCGRGRLTCGRNEGIHALGQRVASDTRYGSLRSEFNTWNRHPREERTIQT